MVMGFGLGLAYETYNLLYYQVQSPFVNLIHLLTNDTLSYSYENNHHFLIQFFDANTESDSANELWDIVFQQLEISCQMSGASAIDNPKNYLFHLHHRKETKMEQE